MGSYSRVNAFPAGQAMPSSGQELPQALHSEVVSLILFPQSLPTLEWV